MVGLSPILVLIIREDGCYNTYRPTSKAGDAIGEISVEILKVPSNFRSGNGVVTSAEIQTDTL